MSAAGPSVWTGRALQAENDDLEKVGLALLYPAYDDAKAAIDRYFCERNGNVRLTPQRAGKRIWGKERQPATFSEANNCKDPTYR